MDCDCDFVCDGCLSHAKIKARDEYLTAMDEACEEYMRNIQAGPVATSIRVAFCHGYKKGWERRDNDK